MTPIKFKSTVGSLSYLSMHYLDVPPAVLKKLKDGIKTRLLCTVNGKLQISWGLMPLAGGHAFIMLSKKRMKELDVRLHDKVTLELIPDESEFGMPVPEELTEVFAQDDEGFRRFLKLSPGKQRNIIHYVNGVKNTQLRIDRALKLINNLKMLPEGKEKVSEIFGVFR
jgi:hypothetical protein